MLKSVVLVALSTNSINTRLSTNFEETHDFDHKAVVTIRQNFVTECRGCAGVADVTPE